MYDWTGKILHLNLTKKTFEIERPDPETYNLYLGGKGFGGRYLRQCATLVWDHQDIQAGRKTMVMAYLQQEK